MAAVAAAMALVAVRGRSMEGETRAPLGDVGLTRCVAGMAIGAGLSNIGGGRTDFGRANELDREGESTTLPEPEPEPGPLPPRLNKDGETTVTNVGLLA